MDTLSLPRHPFPQLAFVVFTLTLAIAPLSTKVGGLSWVLMSLMGLLAFIGSERVVQSNLSQQDVFASDKNDHFSPMVVE